VAEIATAESASLSFYLFWFG